MLTSLATSLVTSAAINLPSIFVPEAKRTAPQQLLNSEDDGLTKELKGWNCFEIVRRYATARIAITIFESGFDGHCIGAWPARNSATVST